MDRKELPEHLLVMDPDYLDDAIVGVVNRINFEAICYDSNKVVSLLMEYDGLSEEEAIEHMEFNMKGSWVGEYTPVFLDYD